MADERRLLHAISRAAMPLVEQPAETVVHQGLQIVCSPIDVDTDGADEAWLAAAAQRHHIIIQRLFDTGPVLPIRFGTSIEAADVGPLLAANRERFASELDRLDGFSEWGVKIATAPAALLRSAEQCSATVRALDAELAASSHGRAYLLRRRREAAMVEAVEERSAELIDHVRYGLAPASVESADLPLPAIAPAHQEVIANIAFLVANPHQAEFEAAVDRIAEKDEVELQLSGPWPPYSFVRLSIGEASA
jgi:hypothetical protein